jgi:hypothetical protein
VTTDDGAAAFIAAKDQLMAEALTVIGPEMKGIVLCCPRCHTDVYSYDLSCITRFYDGDVGLGDCEHCGLRFFWKMRMRPL